MLSDGALLGSMGVRVESEVVKEEGGLVRMGESGVWLGGRIWIRSWIVVLMRCE